MEILFGEARSTGVTLGYYLNTDGLEDERAGQDRVDERRGRAAARRRAAEEAEMAKARAAEEARAKAAAERKAAKSQPIVIGDRVRNPQAGAGTVIAFAPDGNPLVRFDLAFKGEFEHAAPTRYLERVIPGDNGFEQQEEGPDEIATCQSGIMGRISALAAAPIAGPPPPKPFAVDDRISHGKFGAGTILSIDGTKIDILFDGHDGPKRVVASFLDPA